MRVIIAYERHKSESTKRCPTIKVPKLKGSNINTKASSRLISGLVDEEGNNNCPKKIRGVNDNLKDVS